MPSARGEERVERHLEMIQGVVTRMSQNEFAMKGWAIALAAGGIALSGGNTDRWGAPLVGLLPVLVFWGLDAYYLRQGRLFRLLYDAVRRQEDTDFTMRTSRFKGGSGPSADGWLRTALTAESVAPIYVSLAVALLIAAVVIRQFGAA